jgi:hypothetical protein
MIMETETLSRSDVQSVELADSLTLLKWVRMTA